MKQRIISAAVAIAIVVPLFILGGIPFAVGVGALAALAYLETLNPYPTFAKIIGFLSLELLVYCQTTGYGIPYYALCLMSMLMFIPTIFDKKGKYTTKEAFYLLGTTIFLGVFFGLLMAVCNSNKWVLLYLILIATMTDTFAMLIGCLIGKHKLIPEVSPKKSVEGSVAGSIVGTAIASIYYYNIITSDINIAILIIMGLILSVLGQLGDLLFSKIKRENDIKDFSNIMPGHGGILDRLDSLTFIMFGYIVILNIIKLF